MNLHARESGECREQSAAYINELDEKRCGTYDRIVSSTGAVALVPRQRDISALRHEMNDVDVHDNMVHMPWIDESFMDATRLRHISRLWRQLVAGEHRTIDDDGVCDILRLNHYILAPNRDLRDIVVIWWKRLIKTGDNGRKRNATRKDGLLRVAYIVEDVLGMEYGHVGKHLEDVEDISADVFETHYFYISYKTYVERWENNPPLNRCRKRHSGEKCQAARRTASGKQQEKLGA